MDQALILQVILFLLHVHCAAALSHRHGDSVSNSVVLFGLLHIHADALFFFLSSFLDCCCGSSINTQICLRFGKSAYQQSNLAELPPSDPTETVVSDHVAL